jgi:ATP-binding cassette subfamily C protein
MNSAHPFRGETVVQIGRKLLPDAYACLGRSAILLAVVVVLSSIFEGMGLAVLFPILVKLGMGDASNGWLPQLIDRAIGSLGIPNELGPLLAFAVVILLLQVGLQVCKSWCEVDCQMRYAERWRNRIFNSFMDAEWRFFGMERYATRVNAITNESYRVSFAFFLLEQLITATVFIAIYGMLALAASWQMVVILGIFGSLIYLTMRPLSRKGYELGRRVSAADEALQHRATEFIHNAKLIKSTATEALAKAYFADISQDYRISYLRAGFHPKLVYGIYMGAGYVLLGTGTWAAVSLLHINPAAVAVSIYVFLRLYVQVSNFQQCRQSLLLAAPALDIVSAQVEQAEALAEKIDGGRQLPDGPARIDLSNVTVRYGDAVALENLSFDFVQGSTVGVTGASGAGKSTLVDVMVGLIKPARGTVRIDGLPIEDVSRTNWRRSIGYVGQETLMLNGSVEANIAWGGDSSRNEIEKAARAAHAHEFIEAMPRGYATEIGDRGLRLSGGQRQRLGLARALLGRKRLLILDEATSALDSESESEIMSALSAMRGQVTIVMVAHRLSTLRMADRILVFDRGRLVESGGWDRLVAQGGVFARLLDLQSSSLPAPASALS